MLYGNFKLRGRQYLRNLHIWILFWWPRSSQSRDLPIIGKIVEENRVLPIRPRYRFWWWPYWWFSWGHLRPTTLLPIIRGWEKIDTWHHCVCRLIFDHCLPCSEVNFWLYGFSRSSYVFRCGSTSKDADIQVISPAFLAHDWQRLCLEASAPPPSRFSADLPKLQTDLAKFLVFSRWSI